MIYKGLRELKEKSGMSVQQIAAKSGVPASTISRILSGQTDSPGIQTIVDLVRAMGGSLDEVLGLKVETPIDIPKAVETPKDVEKKDYKEIENLMMTIVENEIKPQFKRLTELLNPPEKSLPPKTEIEELREEVEFLRDLVKLHTRIINELKKDQ